MRPHAMFILALALLGAGAAPASAAEILQEGSTLVYRAGPGEKNTPALKPDDFDTAAVQVSDVVEPAIAPGVPCEKSTAMGWWFLSCKYAGFTAMRLEAGDGDDIVNVRSDLPFAGAVSADGGPGNDEVHGPERDYPVTLLGGDGNDKVNGSFGADTLHGGPGNDIVDGRDGNDAVHGNEGDDDLSGGRTMSSDVLDGGPGLDTISSDWNDTNGPDFPLTVTMDGVADDGRPGEGDNVLSIDTIKTRRVATLVAGSDPVTFDVTGTAAGSTKLIGSPQADRLRSYDYDDVLEGRGGNDSIEAGNGNDTINPGPGQDSVVADAGAGSCTFLECRGEYGNDVIDARDGERDSIECGTGTDRVTADAIDVLSNCEIVNGAQGGAACKVPKLKKGMKVMQAKRKLVKAGCRVGKTRKVRSRVRKGRLVGVKAAGGGKVTIKVSRGRR